MGAPGDWRRKMQKPSALFICLSLFYMAAPPVLRKHYKQRAAITAFYTGGPIDLGSDGEFLSSDPQMSISPLPFRTSSSAGTSLASTCGSDVVLLSLVDPAAPAVPVSCNDDTITAICFAPRCLEVIRYIVSQAACSIQGFDRCSGCHSISVFVCAHLRHC